MTCPQCQSTNQITSREGPHIKANCSDCGRFIQFVKQPAANFRMPFGVHKGLPLSQVPESYLRWAAEHVTSENVQLRIQEYLRGE